MSTIAQLRPLSPPTPPGGRFANLEVRNTSTLIGPDTRICMLVYSPAKRGKTTFGSTLDKLTKRWFGKPSLFVAVETGEGGGTMSVQDAGVDFIQPSSWEELVVVLATLQTDTKYGGVIFDSATEYVKRFLQPLALRIPYSKGSPDATRAMGVPMQGDYQTMGEQARQHFNQLVNLTVHPNPNVRKHLIVTALEKEKNDRVSGELTAIQPDLPGAMATTATAMFQTVATIQVQRLVAPDPAKPGAKILTQQRVLLTETEGVRILGDRTGRIPNGAPLDLEAIYEKYWVPRFPAVA